MSLRLGYSEQENVDGGFFLLSYGGNIYALDIISCSLFFR